MTLPMLASASMPEGITPNGAVCLYANSGGLKINAAVLGTSKSRRLIPIVDHHGCWVALLRIEQQFRGVRIRTESLDANRRPTAGAWIEAKDETDIELNWDIDSQGRCRYLVMNAF